MTQEVLDRAKAKELDYKLIEEAQAGSKWAMERLMQIHSGLMWNIVHKNKHRGHDLEELYQEVALVFMRAIHRFDLSMGVSFSTFMVPTLQFGTSRLFRDVPPIGRTKVPRSVYELSTAIHRKDLEDEKPDKISELFGAKKEDAILALQFLKGYSSTDSLEKTIYSDNDSKDILLKDQVRGDVNGHNWYEKFEIREMIKHLPERDQKVLALRYFEDKTQGEVGEILEVSQVQASRIEKAAIANLKRLYLGEEVKDTSKHQNRRRQRPRVDTKGGKKMNTSKNREEAIRLLKETPLTFREISEQAGVPLGSVGYWAKQYRSEEMNKKIREERKSIEKMNSRAEQLTPQKEDLVDRAPKDIINVQASKEAVSINLSLDIHGTKVSRQEAIDGLKQATDILERTPTKEVKFQVLVEGK